MVNAKPTRTQKKGSKQTNKRGQWREARAVESGMMDWPRAAVAEGVSSRAPRVEAAEHWRDRAMSERAPGLPSAGETAKHWSGQRAKQMIGAEAAVRRSGALEGHIPEAVERRS